jgi:hypothetical protein
MTKQQHPITPPPELVQQWLGDFFGCTPDPELSDSERFLATRAAQWGADQELEACCKVLSRWGVYGIDALRAARRPKPPSLKQQAIAELEQIPIDPEAGVLTSSLETIRRALEALPDD